MRILIIEDEKRLAQTLADLLSQSNYICDISHDGESGLDNAQSGIYDAIILDIMLPKKDGFTLLRELRKSGSTTPVLILSARSELEDRVEGLDTGSDYYLTKPFESAELLACLRSILRRKSDIRPLELEFGDIRLNVESAVVSSGTRSISLRAKEFELLRILIENRDKLVPKETLFLKVWGYDTEAEGNVVEVYMTFLRKKLAHIKSRVRITSVRMLGYRLEEADD